MPVRLSTSRTALIVTLLILIATASLVVASRPAAATTTDTLAAPNRLTAGTQVTSQNGNLRLVMQSDGNLVLYTASGRAVWATTTLVAVGSNDNPYAPGTLDRGQSLRSGQRLVSPNGAMQAVMQSDGNFVVYVNGKATWYTRSSGWPGAYVVLQTDGNFVLYTSGGAALWSARTNGTAGNQLIIGNDGDLRLYTPLGQVPWQSAGAALPQLFPPATSAPPTSTSRYIRDLTGSAAHDVPLMQSRGCTDARANPAGHKYLITLPMGAQYTDINGGWGVALSAVGTPISNSAVVTAVDAYVDGYASCMASYSQLLLSIATNNDSGEYPPPASNPNGCPSVPAGAADPLGAAGGQVWATQIVNAIQSHAATKGQITVGGGNDIEPGFAGCENEAEAWTKAYFAATGQPYTFIGSADGCPYSGLGETGTCNYGWTQLQMYNLAYGFSPSHSVPMPQVYYLHSMDYQWVNISAVGVANGKPAIQFGGPLTEVTACQQAGSCSSVSGGQAWNALWSDMAQLPKTKTSGMPYSTDLRIN